MTVLEKTEWLLEAIDERSLLEQSFIDVFEYATQLEAKLESSICGECEKSMLHCTCDE